LKGKSLFYGTVVNSEDKTLAVRIAQGDVDAENYLFVRFGDRIQLLVRNRLRGKVSEEDQKDIIGDIYHAVLVSLRKGGYNPELGNPLEAYIAGIVRNTVVQFFKDLKKTRHPGIPLDEVLNASSLQQNIETTGHILSDLIDKEGRDRLRVCMQKLRPKYLEVLILRFFENKSIEEIAQQLNLERRRVSERINYAFKLLMKECKKDKYFQ
jgi:RNA polymerase sigma-70 factor, ECF subfamily